MGIHNSCVLTFKHLIQYLESAGRQHSREATKLLEGNAGLNCVMFLLNTGVVIFQRESLSPPLSLSNKPAASRIRNILIT